MNSNSNQTVYSTSSSTPPKPQWPFIYNISTCNLKSNQTGNYLCTYLIKCSFNSFIKKYF